ncbi:hypothetical protein D3C85_1537910 [compost metagenome]
MDSVVKNGQINGDTPEAYSPIRKSSNICTASSGVFAPATASSQLQEPKRTSINWYGRCSLCLVESVAKSKMLVLHLRGASR